VAQTESRQREIKQEYVQLTACREASSHGRLYNQRMMARQGEAAQMGTSGWVLGSNKKILNKKNKNKTRKRD